MTGSSIQLLRALQLASRFVAPHCVAACSDALASLPPEAFDIAALTFFYGLPDGWVMVIPAERGMQLRAKARQQLLRLFGDVPAVFWPNLMQGATSAPSTTVSALESPHKRFLALPYAAVLEWLKADTLVVHFGELRACFAVRLPGGGARGQTVQY